jgi:hypothetical protein
VEGANVFLRGQYIGEFNAQFRVPSQEKGTAFRRTSRTDLNWIFTVQTERVVAKDNTVAIGNRLWQIDQTQFRSTLAGSTLTIHEHLDESISIRYGPHVVGRYDSRGQKLAGPTQEKRRGKGGGHGIRRKPTAGFLRIPHSLGNLAHNARFPLSHRADYDCCNLFSKGQSKRSKGQTKNQSEGGLTAVALFYKADRSLINRTGQLDLLTTDGPCGPAWAPSGQTESTNGETRIIDGLHGDVRFLVEAHLPGQFQDMGQRQTHGHRREKHGNDL